MTPATPEVPSTTLVLEWWETERTDAAIYVDDKPVEVPKTGTVKLTLPVRSTQYHIRVTAQGLSVAGIQSNVVGRGR